MSYYNKYEGDLFPGKIAKSEDIHQIQDNIQEAIQNLLDDQYDRTAYILGSYENDFLISPAPKRLGRYIDTMNLADDSSKIWLDINSYGYRQLIKTTKTSVYSIIVQLRNLYSKPQDVVFELWSDDNKISKQTVIVPANTSAAEFEVVFNLEHFSTQHGRDGQDVEKIDAPFVGLPTEEDNASHIYQNPANPDNNSLGAKTLYLVVKAIHKATEASVSSEDVELIDENTFMILANSKGEYARGLEVTADDGRSYESTDYDLYFKHIYSNAPTYLCTGGAAVIHGQPVLCHDTHVTIDGASTSGNTKSYITMDVWGQLKSYTSDAYWGDESTAVFSELPDGELIIAIVYTYNADVHQPKIVQDDTYVENLYRNNKYDEFGYAVRQRSHHERLRRLEKAMAYQQDVSLPSRLKYNLTGKDIVDDVSAADTAGVKLTDVANPQLTNEVANNIKQSLDWSKYFLSTDRYGNFVVKSIDAETVYIPITLKESATIEGKTGVDLAKTIVSSSNVQIDRDVGRVILSQHKVETTTKKKETTKTTTTENVYEVGTTAKQAKETEFNPWDDKKANRPETATIKPKTRAFTTHKGVNGVNVRSSEYPAMSLYIPQSMTLKELVLPVTKFKNVAHVQFHIWKRQGPNNKTNTVWLESCVFSSDKFSLKNAKTKNGYQILDKPFSIKPKGGLKLEKHQYIILVQIFPKSGDGTVYIETYTPKDSSDFLIRYHGSADCAHFRLKTRYKEIWYTSATETKTETKTHTAKVKGEVDEYYVEGRIEGGEIVWENSEPIASITPSINSNIPTGCSIELEANAGSGWKTLTNNQATDITGGTSSFRWRAILKGTAKKTPEIIYDEEKKYAISFTITKEKPRTGGALNSSAIPEDKNVITTQTFYPGDILQKYIGDPNLNTCDKFSNYEWIRIWGENTADANAIIDIAASDTRYSISNNSVSKVASTSCSPKTNEFDIFTTYYADLTFDDFTQQSVDYSNYDNNIEYDEHNLRFKIETDKAYNDDDILILNTEDVTTSLKATEDASESDPISIKTGAKYITAHFNQYVIQDNGLMDSQNSWIWKYTVPDNGTIDLSNYSALKINYDYNSTGNDDNVSSSVSGLALYISSAKEQEPPNIQEYRDEIKAIYGDKDIIKGDSVLPNTLESTELERYKNEILEIQQTINNITYTEYYYYSPNEKGIWEKHQLHNIKSFTIYDLSELTSEVVDIDSDNQCFTISIDAENDNFKYIKEIGLIALNDTETNLGFNAIGSSELTIKDIKGVVQGYNAIYSANKNITLVSTANHCKTALFRDASDQICSLTRIYYNRLENKGEVLGYINNDSITKDANNFAIQFVSDTYLPKDSLLIHLCTEQNGINPIFTLNLPTLNHVYYDSGLASNLFETAQYASKLQNVGTTNNLTDATYNISTTPTAPTKLESGKTVSSYKDNQVIYKVSIVPEWTSLKTTANTLKFSLYREEVTIDSKTKKETYGNREYMGSIYKEIENGDNVVFSGTGETSENDTAIPNVKIKVGSDAYITSATNYNSTNNNYQVKFNYAPGQYKVKIGFQGYSVLVKKSSDTKHHQKLVTYRSATAEFTVNMYWNISNTVNFAQIYKKINEEQPIKSISIATTDKFRQYMNTIYETSSNDDTDAFMHIFIKNMVLHEAEHIPMFHPNIRMKIYSKKSDGLTSSTNAVGIRKVGTIIEYK